jgi:hypothetical protein
MELKHSLFDIKKKERINTREEKEQTSNIYFFLGPAPAGSAELSLSVHGNSI